MAIDAAWLQRVYTELFSSSGIQDILAGRADLGRYFAPDVVIVNFDGHPAAGPFHGHAGVREWVEESMSIMDEPRLELLEILHLSETEGIARVRFLGRTKEAGFEAELDLFIYAKFRDGKTVFSKGYVRPEDALAAIKPPAG